MEFKQNVPIYAANGEAVGHLDRVVVNSDTKAITHIVVQKGSLLKEERVVPISLIAEANDEQILLREDAGDLHGLQQFEEKHYVMSGDAGAGASAVVSQPMAGMPGAVVSEARPKYVKQVEQHIPAGTVALKEGATVVAADGKHIGHVEKVITDAQGEHATHLLISQGKLSKEHRLIPIAWVSVLGEDEVHLTVEPRQVEELEQVPG
jgi:uncharacterized protein YrrD